MRFAEIESAAKRILEKLPAVKRFGKRVYQFISYAISREKIISEGNLIKVSPDDGFEYFYGYYDKCPWDVTDRYMIALKVKQTYKAVAPKEIGEIVLIDTQNNNAVISVGLTHAWNVQQGCMAQWVGPDFESRIIYNDFRDGNYCSVIFNVKEMREEKILPLPVYDVTRDGTLAVSLDFSRLHRLRPGYGYSNLIDKTKNEKCPNKTCIWKMDTSSGEVKELLRYTDLASFESKESMKRAEHKVNHLMISPNGQRFMVLHRWFRNRRKYTRLVTIDMDGGEMYNLSDDVFVSHCYWKNDKEILSFLRKKETGDHYYLMRDKTRKYSLLWPELSTDGHCSYSPDGNYVITDTYPNRKRIASVYLCSETEKSNRKINKICQVFAPFRYDNNCRCDLHPRWNRAGDKICLDSVHNQQRGIYVTPIFTKPTTSEQIPRIIHSVWLGGGKKSDVVEKSISSWHELCPNYKFIEWNENNFNILQSCNYVKQAYHLKKWAFVSDYIRLVALYEYGGIYFDSDMELLRNIDSLLSINGFFCTESKYTICTAIIAAKPKAPWLKDLLTEYDNLDFCFGNDSLNQMPNTKRVQQYLEKNYRYHWSKKPQELEGGLMIYPSDYFSPLNCYTGILKTTENTYGIHHYDNTWKNNKEKMKKKMMQIGTRIVGEDIRAMMAKYFSK